VVRSVALHTHANQGHIQMHYAAPHCKSHYTLHITLHYTLHTNATLHITHCSESVSVLYELTKSDFETFISFYPLDSHLHEFAQQSVASHFMKYDIPFFQSIPRCVCVCVSV
jgi:hypothetical protein